MKEKTKSAKKLIVLCGMIVAFAALMCTCAFAEISETDKAAIGNTGYATFGDAKAAAKNGDTITLLADAEVSTDNNWPIWMKITVDGQNKYGLKINGVGHIEIQVEVRFKNMVINDTARHNYGIFRITGSGHLVLENTAITGALGGVAGPIESESANAKVTMIGSKISGSNSQWNNFAGAAVSMSKGGTFIMDEASEITGITNITGGSNKKAAVAVYGGTGTITVNGKITGNTGAADAAVYAGSAVTVTLGETAEISGNGENSVAVLADEGAVVTDNSGKHGKYGNKLYDPAVVAVSSTGKGYSDVYTALKNSGNMFLLKDSVMNGTGKGNLDTGAAVTLDGQGHKVTVETGTAVSETITFKNITMDVSELAGTAFAIWGGSVTLEDGAAVIGAGNKTAVDGTRFVTANPGTSFNMRPGSSISNVKNKGSYTWAGAVQLKGGNFNMTGGTITGCVATEGGAIFLDHASSVANISGGRITNNTCTGSKGGAIFISAGTLNISGDVYIYNNWDGLGADDIYANTADKIVVNGEFSGKIGVKTDSFAVNGQLAAAADGASLKSADSVICDSGARDYFAYIKDGKLLITHKLALSTETDTGKYVSGEESLGVARVITTVDKAENPGSVEYMGTLFYISDANKETIGDNAVKLTDLSLLASGNGYIADVTGITKDSASIYAVNYYKFYGVDGVVFSEPIKLEYNKSAAKTVEYTE